MCLLPRFLSTELIFVCSDKLRVQCHAYFPIPFVECQNHFNKQLYVCWGGGQIRGRLSQAGVFGNAGVHRKEMQRVDSEVEGDPGSYPSALLSPPESMA